ncbi:MAG TPA: TIGR03013 family XrtA/PEP-CTERM system glycosyltransferase [Bryobacteraceae bacterium]|nr:TIGR03013 family XrtA/PEP-CTERM system glycosyltransferase [Bryobacteraceae bacterium]
MIRLFKQYVAVNSFLLMILEALIVGACLIMAVWLRFWKEPSLGEAMLGMPFFWLRAAGVAAIFPVSFYCSQLYDFTTLRSRAEHLMQLIQAAGYACIPLGLLYSLWPDLMPGRGIVLIGIALAVPLIALCRSAVAAGMIEQKVLILGAGELARAAAAALSSRKDLRVSIVGFLVGGENAEIPAGYKVLGRVEDLAAVARSAGVDRIIVALEERRRVLPVRELVRLRMEGVRVEDAQTAMAELSGRISLSAIQPSWFVFSEGFRRSDLLILMKDSLDLACAVVGFLLTLPIMALVAAAIKLDSKGPVIYRQRRVGVGGRCFEVYKFRSMRTDAEQGRAQWASRNDPRVTRVGAFLRKYRLDELPQFVNVIRGDMSFVGPRPERPEFVEELREVIPYYDERHTVRPGITGWAQVQYEYGASVEGASRKLEYDLYYLKHMSALFDLRIILQTVRTVLSGKGAH